MGDNLSIMFIISIVYF